MNNQEVSKKKLVNNKFARILILLGGLSPISSAHFDSYANHITYDCMDYVNDTASANGVRISKPTQWFGTKYIHVSVKNTKHTKSKHKVAALRAGVGYLLDTKAQLWKHQNILPECSIQHTNDNNSAMVILTYW